MADEPQTPPTPAFDLDALAAKVAENLKPQFAAAAQRPPEPAPEPEPAPTPVGDLPPIKKLLLEHLGPELQALNFQSQSALDSAAFYGAHPEAREYMKDIEGKVREMHRAGVMLDRDSVWSWYKGQHLDEFVKKAMESQQQQQAQLTQAGVAPAGAGLPRGAQPIDIYSMSPEELDKALQGKEF